MNDRRPATPDERKTPCVVCGFPRSQRHHRFPVAVYGENEYTVQLCSTCHTLYHLLYRAYIQKLIIAKKEIQSPAFRHWRRQNGLTFDVLLSMVKEDHNHRMIYDREVIKLGEEETCLHLFERVRAGEFDEHKHQDGKSWGDFFGGDDGEDDFPPDYVRDRLLGMKVVEIHGRHAEDENDRTQVTFLVLECTGCRSRVMVHRAIGFGPLNYDCECEPLGYWRSFEEGDKILLSSVWFSDLEYQF